MQNSCMTIVLWPVFFTSRHNISCQGKQSLILSVPSPSPLIASFTVDSDSLWHIWTGACRRIIFRDNMTRHDWHYKVQIIVVETICLLLLQGQIKSRILQIPEIVSLCKTCILYTKLLSFLNLLKLLCSFMPNHVSMRSTLHDVSSFCALSLYYTIQRTAHHILCLLTPGALKTLN